MKTACPSCQYRFDAPDEYQGRRVVCPSCRNGMEIQPAPTEVIANKNFNPDPPPRLLSLPEGGVVTRILATFIVIGSILGMPESHNSPIPWITLIGGLLLFAAGLVLNYLKRIELWLRPDDYEKK